MRSVNLLLLLLLILSNVVFSLPIFSSSSSTTTSSSSIVASSILSEKAVTPSSSLVMVEEVQDTVPAADEETLLQSMQPITVATEEEEEKCPANKDYNIPVERFAQLVSTHWQFDHLESIKSNTYKIISQQFQQHIEISISSKKEEENDAITQQKTFSAAAATKNRSKNSRGRAVMMDMMMMDLEILHAQIFGAIQAHTEGSLHIAWDRLSDKLGQPAFEQFIKSVTLFHCSSPTTIATTATEESSLMISSTCLKENATMISLELDQYINFNLNQIFAALEQDILPNLLNTISKDLQDVLSYFNRLFLVHNDRLYLQVKQYSSDDLKHELEALLNTQIDVHLTDFFENYACLSRA